MATNPILAARLAAAAGPDLSGSAAGVGALDGVPAFARQAVDWSKVQEKQQPSLILGGNQVVSHVDSDAPTTINVNASDLFTPSVRAHESTHVVQDARTDGVHPGADVLSPSKTQTALGSVITNPADYGYGGAQGLISARAQGKTAGNYSQEQQASMVQNYVQGQRAIEDKARMGKATPQDLRDYSQQQAAYHPFVQQMAPQPAGNTINTRPAAPGLPPADTPGLGLLAPDPLLGGSGVAIQPYPQLAQRLKARTQ